MALRLVLVGVVASLGLTLPSRDALDAWTRCGQSWMNARLAEWESRRPIDDNAYVYYAETSEPNPPVTSTALASSDDQSLKVLVDEWVEAAKKAPALCTISMPTDFPLGWISINELETLAPTAPSVAVAQSSKAAEKKSIDDWQFQLFLEESETFVNAVPAKAPAKATLAAIDLKRELSVVLSDVFGRVASAQSKIVAFSEAIKVAEANVAAEKLGREFDAAMDEMIASFSPAVEPAPKATVVVDNLSREFDVAMDEMMASFTKELPAAKVSETIVATRKAPSVEPADLVEELEFGDFFAPIKTTASAVGVASTPAPPVLVAAKVRAEIQSDPGPGGLANAVRLTREAVNAWANLLHGPAVVTISR